MEIRDYQMRPRATDPRAKRVHAALRSTGGRGYGA